MKAYDNPRVLKRFIVLMALATFVMFSVWTGINWWDSRAPGDYEVREGDILLSSGKFEEAIDRFDAALREQPYHRGAMHGKAAALIELERYDEAEAVLTALIGYLDENLEPDDPTGIGALSAAYANRGIIRDRQGRYEEALDDYVQSVRIDRDIAEGPGWLDHLLYYDHEPSNVVKRARYLYEQLQLPEEERVLRVPELDEQQRMYKP